MTCKSRVHFYSARGFSQKKICILQEGNVWLDRRSLSDKENARTESRATLSCLNVHSKSLHSTPSAPLVVCEDLWVTETKICGFLSDPLFSHSSHNSLYLLPLIISSEVGQTQLVERDRSGAICLRNPLPLISVSVCVSQCVITPRWKIEASPLERLD